MSKYHGHQVIDFVRENPSNREQLQQHYAAEDRFHTCKLSDLTLQELIDFLLQANKLVISDGVLTVNEGALCQH